MENKIFDVKRMSNGRGHSNLLAIITEAIPDLSIGDALQVPFLNGYKDPLRVRVLIDDKGTPVRTNLNSCIVTEYIYE